MKTRFACQTVCSVLTLLGIGSASADIVTLEFGGAVSSVYNPIGAVPSSLIQVGDPVHVSVRYDTTTPDERPDANWGTYRSPGWLKVNIRDLSFERTTEVLVDVLHGANGNQELFQVIAEGDTTAWPEALSSFVERRLLLGIWETQPPIDLLAGPELPTAIHVTRADFAIGEVGVSAGNVNAYTVQYRLAPIPEPSTGRLLVLGSVCGAWWYRRRVTGGVGRRSE